MRIIKLFLLTAITILLVVFCAVNRTIVLIDLFPLPYSAEIPVFILSILSIAMGAFLGGIAANIKLIAMKCSLRKAQNNIVLLENRIKELQNEQGNKLPTII